MKPYSRENYFLKSEIDAFDKATQLVWLLDESTIPDRRELRCHELARALASTLNLEFRDGKFCSVDHSWLIFPQANGTIEPNILDPYAVGQVPMVQLIDTSSWALSGLRLLYRKGSPRDDIRTNVVAWLIQFFEENK